MLVFFADTNSDLYWERVEQMKINMINMPYILDGELKDADLGKNKDYIDFFEKLKAGVEATTCGLNKDEYINYFEPHLKNGDDIIYVTFSHNMSNTFEYMKQAIEELKEKYPERSIDYVNTRTISIGESLIVWQAYKKFKQGASAKEIIEYVEKLADETVAMFVVDDLHHLKKGGRISGATAFFGSILGIKPILYINNEGRVEKLDKAKGKKQAIEYLVNALKQKGINVADYPIIITHGNEPENAEIIEKMVREYVGEDAEIWAQPVGPTIGTHAGPGVLAIAFHGKIN